MLNKEIEEYLNSIGLEGMKQMMEMAIVEMFRNHLIQKFGWYKGICTPQGTQQRCESAWYRFYLDHSRLPKQIDYIEIINKILSEDKVRKVLLDISQAYIDQHELDVIFPDKDLTIRQKRLVLKGF